MLRMRHCRERPGRRVVDVDEIINHGAAWRGRVPISLLGDLGMRQGRVTAGRHLHRGR
jgi:hypothetical protein